MHLLLRVKCELEYCEHEGICPVNENSGYSDLVVVSGMGTINPAGYGPSSLWDSLNSCYSHVEKIAAFDASFFPTQIAAEVANFDPSQYLEPKLIKRTGRATHLGTVAAIAAIKDAGLLISELDPCRIGLFVGASSPQLDVGEAALSSFHEGGLQRVHPFVLRAFFPNATAGAVSSMFGIKGPSITVSTGCSSGSNAIGLAFNSILRAEVDYAVVVGTDSLITPLGMASFCALKNMSTNNDNPRDACRPFDLHRDGFVLGEASGALVLERLHTAKRRAAPSYCSIAGYGSSSTGDDLIYFASQKDGLERAIRTSLTQADILTNRIDFINAHGCGSRLMDEIESAAIQTIFGNHTQSPPVFSIKSVIGHSFAAAGPIQVITSALVFKYGYIPPVTNYSTLDPKCPINVVFHKTNLVNSDSNALLNDFGYGGSSVSLVLQSIPQGLL